MDKKAWRIWLTNYLPSRIYDQVEPQVVGRHGPDDGGRLEPRVLTPEDPAFVDDPYPVFEYLRRFEPLHRSNTGAWVLSRHADVLEALSDPRLGNAPSQHAAVHERNRDRFVCADVAAGILPFIDPPEHARPRGIISRRFHQYLRDHPVPYRELARELLDGIAGKGRVDWLRDFATPMAGRVFMRLLRLPEEDRERLARWSEAILYLFTALPSDELRQAVDRDLTAFRSYLVEHFDPSVESLHSVLAAPDDEGVALPLEQVVDNVMLLFADGIGNTDRAMASLLVSLQRHPEQLRRLQDSPELMSSAVNECLRFESPAQYIGRVAREDLQWYGQTIRKNETVLLLLASANRDETVFENPNEFDVARDPNPHISFGRSRHSCIGALLVRQELQAVLQELLPVLDRIDVDLEGLTWESRPGHRWLGTCPVTMS